MDSIQADQPDWGSHLTDQVSFQSSSGNHDEIYPNKPIEDHLNLGLNHHEINSTSLESSSNPSRKSSNHHESSSSSSSIHSAHQDSFTHHWNQESHDEKNLDDSIQSISNLSVNDHIHQSNHFNNSDDQSEKGDQNLPHPSSSNSQNLESSQSNPSHQIQSSNPPHSDSSGISQMTSPPKPAEKSRAGRKALAAIRGGGGLGAKGNRANVLQQVISKTRPRYLPPKPTIEDKKHLKEFSQMMAASLELQKRKQEIEKEKRSAREKLLASYQPKWEKDVLPNWKSVLRDDPTGKSLRKMWWLGTMPPRHRGRLWHQCIGNAGAVGRSAYTKSVSLAKSLMSSTPSRYPNEVLEAIDRDISVTLPKLKLFQVDKPMHTEFRELLLACQHASS
ncbi:hypothetical protein O181_074209 [Austropuccinia psidii MF-1]|uniref:Rab-GAP TBC domain-containing protein n=1 Tax=Austropuccinia psidii MF-1 TaxID=1389203 RepID=A0A9Q3F868_9BASI|nr:hypothetical protein [Austropuccinia psidii MF-1]